MVGADRDGFTSEDAFAFAKAADEVLTARLERAARRVCNETVGPPRNAVVAGSGEFLARRVAANVLEPGGTSCEPGRSLGTGRLERRLRPCPGRARRRVGCGRDESARRRQGRREPARLARAAGSTLGFPRRSAGGSAGPGRRRRPVRRCRQATSTPPTSSARSGRTRWPCESLDLTAQVLAELVPRARTWSNDSMPCPMPGREGRCRSWPLAGSSMRTTARPTPCPTPGPPPPTPSPHAWPLGSEPANSSSSRAPAYLSAAIGRKPPGSGWLTRSFRGRRKG